MVAPNRFSRLLAATDLAAVVMALGASPGGAPHRVAHPALALQTLIAVVAWVVLATGLRHYDLTENRSRPVDLAMASVLVAASAALVALTNLIAPLGEARVDRFLLLLWPAALATRMAARYHRPSEEEAPEKVLVVGVGPLGRATAEALGRRLGKGTISAFLRFPDEGERPDLPAPLLGTSADLEAVLAKAPVGEVYIAGHSSREAAAMQRVIDTCDLLGVPFALPMHDFRLHHALLADGARGEDGYLHYQEVEPRPTQMALKRLFDIAASATALCLLSPLLLAVALLIRLGSRGPILFTQPRVGLHGRLFQMLKFRSMVTNAEAMRASLAASNEQAGPVFKIKNDPRVTPIGRFIRRHSIDELPQLINVLLGDMSIVGPRPPIASEVARYKAWQRRRLSVRPGLTCIWQVSGRNDIAFDQWMYLDLQYIDHWTLWGDLRLILRTFPVVLTGHGAS